MTQIVPALPASIATLKAGTGPLGAYASVSTVEGARADGASLRTAVRARDAGAGDQPVTPARSAPDETRSAETFGRADRDKAATERSVARIKARMSDMGRALDQLRAMAAAQGKGGKGKAAVAVRGGAGGDAVAILTRGAVAGVTTGAGNDAIAIRAGLVQGLSSGAGSDAVVIAAEVVEGVDTGADADALAILASRAQDIATGAGRDSVAIRATFVDGLDTGAGGDTLAIVGDAVRGIDAGAGDDVVTLDAVTGASQGYGWARGEVIEMATAAGRMLAARTDRPDVDLGEGNDLLNLRITDTIAVRGGAGDDFMQVSGGTVALQFGAGDGNDVISVARGTTVAIQLDDGQDWSAAWDGDALLVQVGDGSIRIEGASRAEAIGIVTLGGDGAEMLHMAATLDRVA